jgi:uncharacterized protein (TIGR02118 family)
MIRLVCLLRRKEGMSLEDFQSYWRNEHAPLVASHARHMNVLRYVQVHALDDPMNDAMAAARGGMEPRYDGVAELWWDSEESLGEAMATADGERAMAELLEDEQRFTDLPNSPAYFNHEYPQVNPTPEDILATPRSTVVKLYFPLRQPEGRDLADAQLYWRTSHGPLIRSQAQALSMLRYMQVHRFETPLEAAIREPRGTIVEPYMGHAEVWFDRGLRRQGPEAAAAGQRAIDDEAKFIDFARSAMWIGKEHPIIQYAG